MPFSGEGAAGQQIRRLRTLLEQVRQRARDLADEVLLLPFAELRVRGDSAHVELPFAGVFPGIF